MVATLPITEWETMDDIVTIRIRYEDYLSKEDKARVMHHIQKELEKGRIDWDGVDAAVDRLARNRVATLFSEYMNGLHRYLSINGTTVTPTPEEKDNG